MAATHSNFDHVLFALLLAVPLVEWRWTWPRFLARLATGTSGVRGRFYRGIVLSQWTVVLLLIAYWRWYGRPWPWLLLGVTIPMRLVCGMAAGVLVAWLLYKQRAQILGNEKAMVRVRQQLERAAPLLPHDRAENHMFKVVSITAGTCEEILFRGFLVWYLAVWTGTMIAVILSSLVFGLGHIYLGKQNVPKTAAAGFVMACLALASGSLWPAIVIHAAMDWNSGEIGYWLMASAPSSAVQG